MDNLVKLEVNEQKEIGCKKEVMQQDYDTRNKDKISFSSTVYRIAGNFRMDLIFVSNPRAKIKSIQKFNLT